MLNKLSAAVATTAFVLGASTAVAQSIPFAEVDTDGDMMLSEDELMTAFGADGAAILLEDDSDNDGMLSVQEIRIATGMGVADPEARAESDDADDPDYRDDNENNLQLNNTETEGFIEEEEDQGGPGGDEDDGQ